MGTYIAHQRNLSRDETFVSTLTGMAAAMGPLLPTPLLSVLLLHELSVMAGRAPKHFMETVCSTGIASTTSWFIFQFFQDDTILEAAVLPFALYDVVQQIKYVVLYTLDFVCFNMSYVCIHPLLHPSHIVFFPSIGHTNKSGYWSQLSLVS